MGHVHEDRYKQIRLKFGTWAELEKMKGADQSFDSLLMELLEKLWEIEDQEKIKERENEQSTTDQLAGTGAVDGTQQRTDWGF